MADEFECVAARCADCPLVWRPVDAAASGPLHRPTVAAITHRIAAAIQPPTCLFIGVTLNLKYVGKTRAT